MLAGVALVQQAGKLPPELDDLVDALRVALGLGYDVGEPGRLNLPAARAMLATIVVAPEHRRGYEREDWPHWLDLNGDCQDARDEALIAESARSVELDERGCNVIGGLWLDPFTGQTFTDPRDLDVDHLVPLAEAHRSGGPLVALARLPPNVNHRCGYVLAWIAVKAAWGLSMDESERVAIATSWRRASGRQVDLGDPMKAQ